MNSKTKPEDPDDTGFNSAKGNDAEAVNIYRKKRSTIQLTFDKSRCIVNV